MAFMLNKFTDADKPKYDNLHLKRPTHAFRYPVSWAVDQDDGAFMVNFGGSGELPPERGEPPNFYCLAWDAQLIEFESHFNTSYPGTSRGGIVTHKVTRIVAPKVLMGRMETAKLMIEEALMAFECSSRYPAEALNVEFSNIVYV